MVPRAQRTTLLTIETAPSSTVARGSSQSLRNFLGELPPTPLELASFRVAGHFRHALSAPQPSALSFSLADCVIKHGNKTEAIDRLREAWESGWDFLRYCAARECHHALNKERLVSGPGVRLVDREFWCVELR
jgi:hypothetical protein